MKTFLPGGWSVAMNRYHDETGIYHMHVDKGRRHEGHTILDRACGYKGTLSGQVERSVDSHKRCGSCLRSAVSAFKAIDDWTPNQCDQAMRFLNGESRNLEEITNNLEFYREHCRYLFRDHAGLTNEDLAD